MKHIILSCAFMIWAGISVNSQEVVSAESENTVQTNLEDSIATLRKALEAKEKEMDKLNSEMLKQTSQLNKLQADYKQVDSLYKVEKKEGKSTLMKKQIKSLQKDSAMLTKRIPFVIDSITSVHQVQLETMHQQRADDSIRIAKLSQELNVLEEFKVKWLTELAESVDETWLNKTYSSVNLLDLETAYQEYEKYSAASPKVAAARDSLKFFVENCRFYAQGIEAVNTPYDSTKVEPLVSSMRALRDAETNAENKNDLTVLAQQLFDYWDTVEIFQDVIKAVSDVTSKNNDKKLAWPLVKAQLDTMEKEDEYISAICAIPWLKKQFEEYRKSLEEDCLNPIVPQLVKQ